MCPTRTENPSSAEMDSLDDLVSWAKTNKIQLDGIAPEEIPYRGVGFVATRKLEEGTVVLQVPNDQAHTVSSIPKNIRMKLAGSSVACQLTVEVAENLLAGKKKPWCYLNKLPAELERNHPLLWPEDVQTRLPPQTQQMLEGVIGNYQDDLLEKQAKFKDLPDELFLHAWIIVHSRIFCSPEEPREHLPDGEGCALLPLAEMFNHSTDGCMLSFESDGYQFTTTRSYERGEEVCLPYGKEITNDTLLTLYGFLLDKNPNDFVLIDELMVDALGETQSHQVLKDDKWLGYKLAEDPGFCKISEAAMYSLKKEEQLDIFNRCKLESFSEDQEMLGRYPLLKKRRGQISAIINKVLDRVSRSWT